MNKLDELKEFLEDNGGIVKLVGIASILIFLLIIVPKLQNYWIMNWLQKNSTKPVTNDTLQILVAEVINNSKEALMVYLVNVVINICDALCITSICITILKYLGASLFEDNELFGYFFIFLLSLFLTIAPLIDIYKAGLKLVFSFDNLLRYISNMIL